MLRCIPTTFKTTGSILRIRSRERRNQRMAGSQCIARSGTVVPRSLRVTIFSLPYLLWEALAPYRMSYEVKYHPALWRDAVDKALPTETAKALVWHSIRPDSFTSPAATGTMENWRRIPQTILEKFFGLKMMELFL